MSDPTRRNAEALEAARALAAELRTAQLQQGQRGQGMAGAFESAPNVQQKFQDAKEATQPLEPPSPGPHPRTTSAAKIYDPIRPQKVAEPTTATNNNPIQSQGEQDQGGSEMIRNQKTKTRLVPEGPERKAMDADVFSKDLAAEQVREEAKALAAELRASQQQQGQQQDQGLGMG